MLIFGYNSEVRDGDTIYHVQSEARSSSNGANGASASSKLLLESQIFVGGRCIAKCATPCQPAADLTAVQESLRLQHRSVLDSLRRGGLDLGRTAAERGATMTPTAKSEPLPQASGFLLRCMGAYYDAARALVMRFQLTEAGAPKSGVWLRCFLAEADSVLASELIAELRSDRTGMIELRVVGAVPHDAELQIELEGERSPRVRRFSLAGL
jgi:hypothetical protein